MNKLSVLIFILCLSFLSCGKKSDQPVWYISNVKNSPNSDLIFAKVKANGRYGWKSHYNVIVSDAIDAQNGDLLDLKIEESHLRALNCPNYNMAASHEKKIFWSLFFAGMANYESSFNPLAVNRKNKQLPSGLMQIGLGVLKYPKYYPHCQGLDKQSIFSPQHNLSCSVNIMTRQLEGSKKRRRPKGQLFPAKAFYWEVLTNKKQLSKVRDLFKKYSKKFDFCR